MTRRSVPVYHSLTKTAPSTKTNIRPLRIMHNATPNLPPFCNHQCCHKAENAQIITLLTVNFPTKRTCCPKYGLSMLAEFVLDIRNNLMSSEIWLRHVKMISLQWKTRDAVVFLSDIGNAAGICYLQSLKGSQFSIEPYEITWGFRAHEHVTILL